MKCIFCAFAKSIPVVVGQSCDFAQISAAEHRLKSTFPNYPHEETASSPRPSPPQRKPRPQRANPSLRLESAARADGVSRAIHGALAAANAVALMKRRRLCNGIFMMAKAATDKCPAQEFCGNPGPPRRGLLEENHLRWHFGSPVRAVSEGRLPCLAVSPQNPNRINVCNGLLAFLYFVVVIYKYSTLSRFFAGNCYVENSVRRS